MQFFGPRDNAPALQRRALAPKQRAFEGKISSPSIPLRNGKSCCGSLSSKRPRSLRSSFRRCSFHIPRLDQLNDHLSDFVEFFSRIVRSLRQIGPCALPSQTGASMLPFHLESHSKLIVGPLRLGT